MSVFRSNIYPEGTEFICPVCNGHFISGSRDIQCLVAHPDGDCCHYTDKQIKVELGHHIGPAPTSEEMGLTRKKNEQNS